MIKHLLSNTQNGHKRSDSSEIDKNPLKSSKSPSVLGTMGMGGFGGFGVSAAPLGLWRDFQDSRSKFLSTNARKHITNDVLTPGTSPATLVKPVGTGKTHSKSAKVAQHPSGCRPMSGVDFTSGFSRFLQASSVLQEVFPVLKHR